PFRASPPGSRWGSTSGSGGRSCLTCQPLTALVRHHEHELLAMRRARPRGASHPDQAKRAKLTEPLRDHVLLHQPTPRCERLPHLPRVAVPADPAAVSQGGEDKALLVAQHVPAHRPPGVPARLRIRDTRRATRRLRVPEAGPRPHCSPPAKLPDWICRMAWLATPAHGRVARRPVPRITRACP